MKIYIFIFIYIYMPPRFGVVQGSAAVGAPNISRKSATVNVDDRDVGGLTLGK